MTGDTLVIGVPVATVWTAPDAPRSVDSPASRAVPDIGAWTDGLDSEARHGLHGLALTQALLGEPVVVVEERAGWSEVVLPWQPSATDERGYRGWVLSAHITVQRQAAGVPSVAIGVASVRTRDLELSFGTVLPLVYEDQETVALQLPDGTNASVPTSSVVFASDVATADDLLASARQFIGQRYLWGGTSGWGMDCSGIVHLTHRVHGITVPRDASDQERAAERVPTSAARRGDLFFFARPAKQVHHVGFTTNSPHEPLAMLHAPETDQLVENIPLPPERVQTLVGAGTFL